jgi:hypothetical protein
MSGKRGKADAAKARANSAYDPKATCALSPSYTAGKEPRRALLSRIRRDPKRHRPCSPACDDGTSREKIQIPAAIAEMASAEATLTALSSPTSGSEGNLRTHRECVELGAGIPGVGRADLLGNVAVQVIKHETNVAIDVPVQTRSVDCLPPTRNTICSP